MLFLDITSPLISYDSEIPALWSRVQRGPTSSVSVSCECFLWLRFMDVQMVYSSRWAQLPLKIYGGKHVSIEVNVKMPIAAMGLRFHSQGLNGTLTFGRPSGEEWNSYSVCSAMFDNHVSRIYCFCRTHYCEKQACHMPKQFFKAGFVQCFFITNGIMETPDLIIQQCILSFDGCHWSLIFLLLFQLALYRFLAWLVNP